MQYLISGKVVKGDGYGKKLGFPTVNLAVGDQILPPPGVYAGEATLDGQVYRAGIVIGPDGKTEAHLIDYNGDAYDKTVALKIHKFLRSYKNFDSEEDLKEQIGKDLKEC